MGKPAVPANVAVTGDLYRAIPALIRQDPREFLRRWHFVNRETGEELTFAQLWPGQEKLLEAGRRHRFLFALKAGKLGFSELACAWDAYRALTAHPHARVHILSKDLSSARALLSWVRYGLERLPPAWGVRLVAEEAGGATTTELRIWAPWFAPDDRRVIRSYASEARAAIDQTAAHTHADEFCHLDAGRQEMLFRSLMSTVEPETGTFWIVSRGAGPNFGADLFRGAQAGANQFHPLFAPWTDRPRPQGWREEQARDMPGVGLMHFAPEDVDDALAGEETAPYIPVDLWDSLHDPNLPPLTPGSREPIVLALDAGVTGDFFAAVAVSRRPDAPEFPAIRAARVWRPGDFPGGRVNFDVVEAWVRMLLEGGCPRGHPRSKRPDSVVPADCPDCRPAEETPAVPPLNVVQLTFDPYQLEHLYQTLRRSRLVWLSPFDQGSERLRADAALYAYAVRGQLRHNGAQVIREELPDCRAKMAPEEDTRLRIVKRTADSRIDAVVAASMAVHRAMSLNLG